MTSDKSASRPEEALDALSESTRAWWTSVLAGQVDAPHPVYGANLKAQIDGDTLVVSGTVPTEEDRRSIAAETEHLKGHGITTVRNELEVVPDVTDESGLLSQTLVGIFENAELADFAQGNLKGHAQVRPKLIRVINPDPAREGRAELRAALPEAFWDDADKALDEGHALLIVTVDETEAFKAREVLDEETRSLQTLVLPPEAAGNTATAQRSLDQVGHGAGASGPVK
ncbi:MAG TPA: BON domain-containing protein [Dehalococcoidia bacterium]|nr:BON domain-containing protein [Dehalococcoidia bacterium]